MEASPVCQGQINNRCKETPTSVIVSGCEKMHIHVMWRCDECTSRWVNWHVRLCSYCIGHVVDYLITEMSWKVGEDGNMAAVYMSGDDV